MQLSLAEIRNQLDQLICATPSGPIRNGLCNANIHLMAAERGQEIKEPAEEPPKQRLYACVDEDSPVGKRVVVSNVDLRDGDYDVIEANSFHLMVPAHTPPEAVLYPVLNVLRNGGADVVHVA
jgi:hypothetical protein